MRRRCSRCTVLAMPDKRNRLAAALLALCFPFLGAHRFYCGNVAAGVATIVVPFCALALAGLLLLDSHPPAGLVIISFAAAAVPALWNLISGLYLLSISDSTFEQDLGGSYPGSAYRE